MSRIYDALEQGLKVKNPPAEPAPSFNWPVNGDQRGEDTADGLESEMIALYHAIRSALPGVNHPSVLLLGSRSNEGASTIARELARTASASMGKTVLLIDLDRSRPDLHVYRRLRPEKEIDELAKTVDGIEQCLCRVEESSLYVMPLFQRTMCTPRILETTQEIGFWQPLKERFDLIIVDSPPATMLPDGLALVSHVDGVILVVEAEKTRWQVALAAKEKILDSGGAILGIVFNKQRHYIPQALYKHL